MNAHFGPPLLRWLLPPRQRVGANSHFPSRSDAGTRGSAGAAHRSKPLRNTAAPRRTRTPFPPAVVLSPYFLLLLSSVIPCSLPSGVRAALCLPSFLSSRGRRAEFPESQVSGLSWPRCGDKAFPSELAHIRARYPLPIRIQAWERFLLPLPLLSHGDPFLLRPQHTF